jgi:hypothetical protein
MPSAPTPLGAALRHPLNFLLLGSSALSAALSGSLIPLAVGAATELAWLAVGPRLASQRRILAALAAEGEARRGLGDEQVLLRVTREADRRRFLLLDQLRRELAALVERDPNLSPELFVEELGKVEHLVGAFLRLAAQVGRIASLVDPPGQEPLEEALRRARTTHERLREPAAKVAAGAELEVLERRLEESSVGRRRLAELSAELDLIEQKLFLVRDRVVAMQAPSAFGPELDELVRSVALVEASLAETEALTAPSLRAPAVPARRGREPEGR